MKYARDTRRVVDAQAGWWGLGLLAAALPAALLACAGAQQEPGNDGSGNRGGTGNNGEGGAGGDYQEPTDPVFLPARIRRSAQEEPQAVLPEAPPQEGFTSVAVESNHEWLSLSDLEAQYVALVLSRTGGNKQAASRILGIDRKTLTRILSRRVSQT